MISELKELENLLKSEIETYSNVEKCVMDKKNALIKGDIDSLSQIDQLMTEYIFQMEKHAVKRAEINKKFGKERMSLNEIVKKAASQDKVLAERIESYKNIIESKINNIKTIENTNKELLRHGLKLVESTIKIIASVLNPNTSAYNNRGKANENVLRGRSSSIVKEA